MIDTIVVIVIIIAAVAFALWRVIRLVAVMRGKKEGGCSTCSGNPERTLHES